MRAYQNLAPVRDPEQERLLTEHIEMARRIALRIGRRVPAWLRQEDLIGAAMIGLAEAVNRFDPLHGQPFPAFAEKRIRGAVLDELRRGDILPRRTRNNARKVGKVINRLEHTLGRSPIDEEVAAALGVSLDEYREELEVLTRISFVDFDVLGDGAMPQSANDNYSPAAQLERNQLVEKLHAGLKLIPERDAQVLSLYYVEELTYAEVAEVLGVSESRVCQLHARALSRLRATFEGEGDE